MLKNTFEPISWCLLVLSLLFPTPTPTYFLLLFFLGVIIIYSSFILQDYCFTQFGSSEDEVVFASYAGGSLLLLAACLATGELSAALAFINVNFAASRAVPLVSLGAFATCGYCGVLCVTSLTRRFGPLVASLTTTARKAVTLVLSFALFPKPVNSGHFVGAALFIAGIVVKAVAPHQRRRGKPQLISSSSSTVDGGNSSSSSSSSGSSCALHGSGSSGKHAASYLGSVPSCSELPSELPSVMTSEVENTTLVSKLSGHLLPYQASSAGNHTSALASKTPGDVV